MESYYGISARLTQRTVDQYIRVNNFGYNKNIDTTLMVSYEKVREDYQILYVDKGYGRFSIYGELQTAGAGSIVIIYPGIKYMYEFPKDAGTDYYWIHFAGEGVAEMMKTLKLQHGIYQVDSFRLFIENMDKMAQACAVMDFTTETFLIGALLTILSVTSKKVYVAESPIYKIMEQMQNENFNTMTIKEYARLCGMSEYHFIRKFKQITGITPLQYKTKLIVNKAIELLSTTNLNISETAYMLGFEDSLYFSRLFKKETGLSPKNYMKQEG